MDNNMFENKDASSEIPVFQNDAYPQTQPSADEVELELDPELTNPPNESDFENSNNYNENSSQQPIEPIAPIMPQIEKTTYKPIEQSSSSKGIKVFALIIALMVIVSASVTGGYYLGAISNNGNTPTVDLASKPKPENALTTSQVYNDVSPSVVGIYVYNTENGISSTATGVIYSKDGYIITNDHIYDGIAAAKFKVYTHDKKMYSADFVAGDTRSDLAVLKITDANNTSFTPAKLGNSAEAVVGESVIAIGRPNGATNPSIASEGIISVVSTRVSTTSSYTSSLIQTDSAINPGSSGGALCNVYGQVIGITSAKLVGNEYDGVGYAIPTYTVKKVVDSLIKHKTVKGRAKLGISYLHIDELSAELSKVPCGLQIAAIDESSDLYGKSVAVKDIITHVNSVELTDSNIILDIIDASKPGDTLELKIYSVKGKKSLDITVKLLEDNGSSSYTSKKEQSNKNDKEYNSSEFNFPNGE
ncbi:MAG: serine protease [Clostridia bacterium]|nr:serine protease [Clostridia bacterium]